MMGFFDRKYCDICGGRLGPEGGRKLDNGNMCKACAEKLSPCLKEGPRVTL